MSNTELNIGNENICLNPFTKESGIYFCKCIGNGKVYVGQSINLHTRVKRSHIPKLRNNRHGNQYLQNSWNKYGEESFVWGVIEYCAKEDLNIREAYWIEKLNTVFPNGFNLTTGGDNSYQTSELSRKKMSESWDESRRKELSERNKKKWESMSEDERNKMHQTFVDSWTDERKTLISSKKKEHWDSLTDEEVENLKRKISEHHADVSGDKNPRSRTIKCLETGDIFTTIKEAAIHFGINYSTLKACLRKKVETHGLHFEFI